MNVSFWALLAGPGLGHSSTVWDIAFNAAGTRMVSCSDDLTLRIWNCTAPEGVDHACSEKCF